MFLIISRVKQLLEKVLNTAPIIKKKKLNYKHFLATLKFN